ncbi:MAG: hypothetical protein JNL82_36140 [Myxococcales bacterium]|nr:hypothetical protein [Myxococcales bacterium]
MSKPTLTAPRAALAAACLLAAACDPWSTPTTATTPLAARIDAYGKCYGECYTSRTSATNRETCKLECDDLAELSLGAAADPAARRAYEHLRGCLVGCWDDRTLSETNRATCLLTCSEDAEIEATPAPKQTLEVVPGTELAPGTELPPGVRPAPR